MNSKPSRTSAVYANRWLPIAILLMVGLMFAGPVNAQKKKKTDTPAPANPVNSLPDEQRIDYGIGQMLGAWQLGDTATMHKFYADDVSVVAGTWTPPAIGWTNYLAAYQMQRARMQQVRLDRSNTLIRVDPSGTFAWACYQWEFSAVVDGAPSAAEGQTTLVLQKRNNDWLIVHNHTSIVQASQPAAPAPTKP